MAKIQTRDPKKVEALLKLRQSMQASQDMKDASASALSRPTLNSTIALKNKALNQSRSVPRVPEEEVEREVKRMEEAGQLQVEMGVVDTLEASMVLLRHQQIPLYLLLPRCRVALSTRGTHLLPALRPTTHPPSSKLFLFASFPHIRIAGGGSAADEGVGLIEPFTRR